MTFLHNFSFINFPWIYTFSYRVGVSTKEKYQNSPSMKHRTFKVGCHNSHLNLLLKKLVLERHTGLEKAILILLLLVTISTNGCKKRRFNLMPTCPATLTIRSTQPSVNLTRIPTIIFLVRVIILISFFFTLQ